MSRLAKKPIKMGENVTMTMDGNILVFKGPKGEAKIILPTGIFAEEKNKEIFISFFKEGDKKNKDKNVFLGTGAALIKNTIAGIKEVFEKKLEIEGVGYKAQADGNILVLSLGFTHPVKIQMPDGVSFKVEKNTIIVSGVDKEKVGKVAAKIRAQKPPEPYKGKGIHYFGETIRRKAGKKAVSTA